MKTFITPFITLFAALGLCACSSEKKPDKSPDDTKPSSPPVVEIVTTKGSIRVQLDNERAPLSTENFLDYVAARHFDGTIFHRVMEEFMIQGGGFAAVDGGIPEEKATRPPIKNEASNGLANKRGTIAMARTNDPHSATSQFFINVVDNTPNLGPGGVSADGYAVFGEVISGMEVVDAIRAVAVGNGLLKSMIPSGDLQAGPSQNVPIEPVIIKSIRLVEGL